MSNLEKEALKEFWTWLNNFAVYPTSSLFEFSEYIQAGVDITEAVDICMASVEEV